MHFVLSHTLHGFLSPFILLPCHLLRMGPLPDALPLPFRRRCRAVQPPQRRNTDVIPDSVFRRVVCA